jgi:hypothetical protein
MKKQSVFSLLISITLALFLFSAAGRDNDSDDDNGSDSDSLVTGYQTNSIRKTNGEPVWCGY